MEMVQIKINGQPLSVAKDSTILQAAREAGIDIPTLCYLREINEIGACRICMVEVKGAKMPVAACVYPVNEGMEVLTNTPKIMEARRTTLELILSNHDKSCLSCVRSGDCELQRLSKQFGVDDTNRFMGENITYSKDESSVAIYRDNNKCVLCRRCVAACSKQQDVAVIGPNNRGFNTHIACAFEQPLADVACVSCGQCIVACPTGALAEKDEAQPVWEALADPSKHVLVQPAPSIRATLGEEFGLAIGTNCEGKMAAALRRLGFDKVFDTDFGADLTIMEEANEFVERLKNNGPLPLITSCSPGWVKYCEHKYPDMLENLSSCKSPMTMFGAIAKTWYAEKNGIDPADIFVVGVMPCTAKKFEARRPNEAAAGYPDVDAVLTTRELGRMIKRAGIDFVQLPDEKFDELLGESTGAGAIFGATGGVMEAALRTAVEWITGQELADVNFHEVRGTQGVKEATYTINGQEVNVAVASGLSNAHQLLEKVRSGEKQYHFIEVMACPGGCVNGGGQPVQQAVVRNNEDLKGKRAQALYHQDEGMKYRKSHENPTIKVLYNDFLEKPGSHKAHKVLHTVYEARSRH